MTECRLTNGIYLRSKLLEKNQKPLKYFLTVIRFIKKLLYTNELILIQIKY